MAGSIDVTKLAANVGAGWTPGLAVPNTVTYNGNRNYSLVFNATDLTPTLSSGMRLKLTRTVTAPTQCTSLNGTTQYYSKTSPSGLSFTTAFTVMAWVKLSSYALGGIMGRRNADTEGWDLEVNASGQLTLSSLRIVGNNKAATSSQSLPLNKWVHVAVSMDMTAGASSGATWYIDGVSVPGTVTQTGTATAIVQGTTALVVGAQKSDGTAPFSGKIAQAAVFSAVLSQATIQSYISQGLAGTETSLISAYSFNNSINDLNANANNLTANGSAVATNVDSPFAGGANASTAYTAGTTEFGEVFGISFSTNTTVVVQVPDGLVIPTSGGVSALAYSTQAVPLGWPLPGGIKIIGSVLAVGFTTNSTAQVAFPGLSCPVYVPLGRRVKATLFCRAITTTAGSVEITTTKIWRGTVGSGVCIGSADITLTSTTNGDAALYLGASPDATSGSQTYNVGVNIGLAANTSWNGQSGTSTDMPYLLLELD